MTLIAMVTTNDGEIGLIADRVAGECFSINETTSKVGHILYTDDALGECRVLVGVSGEFFKLPIAMIGDLLKTPPGTLYERLSAFGAKLLEITQDSSVSLIFKSKDSGEVLLATIIHAEKEAGISIVFPNITNAKSSHGSLWWAVANLPGYQEGEYLPLEDVARRLKHYSRAVFGDTAMKRAYDLIV